MELLDTYRSPNCVFLCSCFIMCGFLSAILTPVNGLLTHTVNQSDNVILECNNSTNSDGTWTFNNETINVLRNLWGKRFKPKSRAFLTETYSLHIQNVSIEHEGIYQCKIDSKTVSKHFLKVEVIPKIYLTINGVNPIISFVRVPRNESVIVTCLASSARPSVNITWLLNNRRVKSTDDNQTIFANSNNNNTFDTLSSISFQPDGYTGTISCVINGLSQSGLSTTWKFQVETEQSTEYDQKISSSVGPPTGDATPLNITLIITPSIFIFILVSFVLVNCVVRKIKASRKSQVPVHQNVTMEESYGGSFDTKGMPVRLSKRCPDYSRRLTLGLTGGPDEITMNDPDYSFLPEFEGDYYSMLQVNTSRGRNFNAKDMCLLLNMKMGPVYNKWMGTVAIDNDNTKSVVISTITDQTLRSKEIHWDEYVKRLLDLPTNKNLVSVVGVCIDAVSLYLLHEHVVCETLDKRIQATKTVDASKPNLMTPSQALSYVRGILQGMELAHSYGFLHPGLTTKKILVTNEGACKLYDFCLSKDADKRVAIEKTQTVYNLNHFAPETLLRNAYTQACDVWSVGVVIWEIFSGGFHPFPATEESVSSLDKLPLPPDEWPERYQTLKNRRVFDCWEEEVSLRPSLKQLRLSFAKTADSLEPCDDEQAVTTSLEPEEETGDAHTDENTYEY